MRMMGLSWLLLVMPEDILPPWLIKFTSLAPIDPETLDKVIGKPVSKIPNARGYGVQIR